MLKIEKITVQDAEQVTVHPVKSEELGYTYDDDHGAWRRDTDGELASFVEVNIPGRDGSRRQGFTLNHAIGEAVWVHKRSAAAGHKSAEPTPKRSVPRPKRSTR